MSAIDNCFWDVDSENLNLILPYEQNSAEYKMAKVMLKGVGLNTAISVSIHFIFLQQCIMWLVGFVRSYCVICSYGCLI